MLVGRKQKYERDETLDKAMLLFWSNGYDGTTLKDLELCLDLRPGSIYSSFGSKELFYLEALDAYVKKTATNLNNCFEKLGFSEGLKLFIKEAMYNQEGPSVCMIGKTISDNTPRNIGLKKKAIGKLKQFEMLLLSKIEKALETGELESSADPHLIAKFINIQILGLRCYAQTDYKKLVVDSILDKIITAIKYL